MASRNFKDIQKAEKKAVNTKFLEISEKLSERTGVNQGDVQVVLDALGIKASLGHRIHTDKVTGTKSFKNVSIEALRVATGNESL